MSDYLWDKSGEADPEIERLENLLGGLRYQQKPLEMPLELPVRPRRTFVWPRLAAAAALVLMILAGLWIGILRHSNQVTTSPPVAMNNSQLTQGGKEGRGDGSTQAKPALEEKSIEQLAHVSPSKSDHKIGRYALKEKPRRMSPRNTGHVVPQRWSLANSKTPQYRSKQQLEIKKQTVTDEQTAKEQLMLALHLASAKLNAAQRKVEEITNPE